MTKSTSLFTQVLHSNTFVKRDFKFDVCKYARRITFVFYTNIAPVSLILKTKLHPIFRHQLYFKVFFRNQTHFERNTCGRNTVRKLLFEIAPRLERGSNRNRRDLGCLKWSIIERPREFVRRSTSFVRACTYIG